MPERTTQTVCQQGFVTKRQVLCTKIPFFINSNGDIAFETPHNVVYDIDAGREKLAKEIVTGLNDAFKLGYECDRFEWE